MKPAAARRVERELREIMRRDGDNCSVCRKPFPHNTTTTGGTTKAGNTVLVGECCQAQVADVVIQGMFLDGSVDDLVPLIPTTGRRNHQPAEIERAVAGMRNIFAERQAMAAEISKRAGLPRGRSKVFSRETAWKSDDMRWFEQHPARSHRLRPIIDDEAEATGFAMDTPMPPRHEMQVLVRQVEPGKRMRLAFGRNLDVPIPDDETVLHALFDIVGADGGSGEVISMDMMRKAIERYDVPSGNKPS